MHPIKSLFNAFSRMGCISLALTTGLFAVDQNGGHREDYFNTTLGGPLVEITDYTLVNIGQGDKGPEQPSWFGSLKCSYQHSDDVRTATLLKVTRTCGFNIVVKIDLNMSLYNTVNPLAEARGFGYGAGKAFNGSDVQADQQAQLAQRSEPLTGSIPIPTTGLSIPYVWNTGTGVHMSPATTGLPGQRIWQPNLSHNPGALVSDADAPVIAGVAASSYSGFGTAANVNVRISVNYASSNPAEWEFPEP